jgi:hypothetical protein
MHQPYPPNGHPAEPPRPPAPAPVLTAVKLMYAGAAVSTATLTLWLAIAIRDVGAAARGRWLGHNFTAGLLSQLQPLIITMLMVTGLVVIALWLWMARANGQGRDWARVLSTVLSGLAALELSSILSQPTVHASIGGPVLSWIVSLLTWRIIPALTCLTGLAAVWLLWRPASSAFFKPHRTQAW